jgi:hypothetical protein
MNVATDLEREYRPPAGLDALQGRALIAGVVGLVVAALGWLVSPAQFFQAYLVAFLSWLAVALGCFGLLMLQHMTGGGWGVTLRRVLEAASRTLPLLLLLFLPLVLGLGELYHWSHAEAVEVDPVLQHKHPYLNVPAFLVRAGVFFGLWIVVMLKLTALSREQDRTGDPALFRRLQAWSAAGFLVLALTGTFASMDWMMSLDPHWFSSLFGLWYLTGAALSGLCLAILMAKWLADRPPMEAVLAPRLFHDYGKLLLALVMLWAYLSFSQLMLIWGANLPEEITFYLQRLKGPWMPVSVLLLFAHFVLPFLILLSSGLKQRKDKLVQVAAMLLVLRWVDHYWNVVPTLQMVRGDAASPLAGLWIGLTAVVGVGGIWVWGFLRELAKQPLLPVQEPFLGEILAPSREALAHD